ncbi:DNA polymerase III subunit delta [Candidatus Pelagibacter sp. Uisw_113]|uniref:DNA polymerase III subunit delta n=1 Tax=Candidatus Pelagibacter sp. Uisw_113 TaxID=3230994 RepID=UPI0039EC5D91
MILKSFEIEKIKIEDKNFFLFYGENQGHKNQIIEEKFKKKYKENTYYYDENEILNNENNFFNNILSKSFFENEKLIVINRATDKIKKILEELIEKKIQDLVIVLNANTLEKKSKIRSLFEKSKDAVCVPFYEDNNQTLSAIVSNFFREKKIPISQLAINLIAQRARGDRQNIKNELEKVANFIKNKNKIEIQDLLKLTNLAENYNVSELIDCCLSKNKKRTINILNENNYSLEDCILIIRTFLIKTKRLIKLSKDFSKTKNLDITISGFKPPIFWKEKDVVKQQIKSWSYKDAEDLMYEINTIELLIKKYSNNSINILSDFIIKKSSTINS